MGWEGGWEGDWRGQDLIMHPGIMQVRGDGHMCDLITRVRCT